MTELIRNNRGAALFMVLTLLIVMVSLASVFVVNLSSSFSFFHKQVKSQIAFNLAESGIESAIWHLREAKSRYKGEKETMLGEGTFTVTVDSSKIDAGHVTVTSHGFYPDSNKPQAECTLTAVLDVGKDVRVLLWKQVQK